MISYDNEMGKLGISDDILATIAGMAAVECQGVAGMANRRLQDELADILGKENPGRGVEVIHKQEQLILRLFVIIHYGSRIREVARQITEKVSQSIQELAGVHVDRVEIQVDGVRFPDDLRSKNGKRTIKRLFAPPKARFEP